MASSNRPGVEITQEIASSSSTPSSPALVPLVMGVCRQIIEVLDSDGGLNSDAKYPDARYNQASMFIPQADFPDPRENIDELNIDEETVGVSLYFGGSVRTLDRGSNDSYGSAFLKLMNKCRAAALRTSVGDSFAFDATVGDAFTFAFDVVNPVNVSSDITVTFVGTLTAEEVAEAINEAVGSEVATVVDVSGSDKVQLTSPTFGATSSITIRAGTSALTILFGASFDASKEYRVEGAGFRGQDDEDSDLTTPWLEFYRGGYFEDDSEQLSFDAAPTANLLWAGQVDLDETFNTSKAAAVTYTGTSATVPLAAATAAKPGDQMWADGSQVGSGEITKIEASRFKIGKLNSSLSTFDDDGNPTNRVYDTIEVNTENHGTPFAPKYAYFRAQALEYGSITPEGEAATLTGSNQGLASRSAYVQSTGAIAASLSLASLTLIFQVTEDGVEGEEVTYTFAGGPYTRTELKDLLAAADEFGQLTISISVDNRLVLTTTKAGADQSVTVKSTGTANTALLFSTTAATTDTGKDVEFATQAALTSDFFALPMVDLTTKVYELTIEDSKGTHTVTTAAVSLATDAGTLAALTDKLCEAFGSTDGTLDPTIYDGGIPIATMTNSGGADTTGTITITTIEGGASVTLAITAVDETDGFRFLGFHDDTGDAPAQLDSVGGVTDFSGLGGILTVGATSGFDFSTTGVAGGNPAAVVISLSTGTGLTLNELAADLETQLEAAMVGAGAASGLVSVIFDFDDEQFEITVTGAASITIADRTGGTNLRDVLFDSGASDAQAVATWLGGTPSGITPADIVFTWSDDGGGTTTTITGTATYAMAGSADAEELTELLNAAANFNGITAAAKRLVEWFSADNDVVSVRTIDGGVVMELEAAALQAGFTAMGFDVDPAAYNDAGAANGTNADDGGADALKSTILIFNLDDNPYDYEITFATNSLQAAIDDINELVDGAEDVASEDTRKLVLTSLLAGAASKVAIDSTSTADTVFGITGTDEGAGRPDPDFYLDGDGAVHIGPNILRNRSSGIPFSLASALADVYIPYTALRKDVTASAEDPALLTFESTEILEASIGPISINNPLCLGVFLALANSPTQTISALGIDEESAAAPYGTLDGWSRAIEYIESKEVYAIAPLTADEYVQGLLSTHVQAMSAPEERGERILFIWAALPDRAVTVTVASGENGESNGTENSFTLDVNPASDLIENGIDPSDEISVDDNLYLELVVTTLGVSELRRYSVQEVNGVVIALRVTFADGENTDGFFTTETLDEELSAADWTLKIRGDRLYVTGTTIPDLAAEASAAASQAAAFAHRRVYYLACDSVDTSIDGVTQNVEGFYLAAAIAGMVAEQPPQQPFTNFPVAGFTRVYGTDDTYNGKQLDTIADAGRYVMVNLGGVPVARKQLSTDPTSIQTKELSITKAIDWLAKGLRATNRVFIGRSVITSGFLDQLTLCNEGFLDYAELLGVVRKAELTKLLQDTDAPDTVLIDVSVEPVYPCNKIKITIVS